MTDPNLPHGIFDAEAYYLYHLESALKKAEWALRNLGNLALRQTNEEEEDA